MRQMGDRDIVKGDIVVIVIENSPDGFSTGTPTKDGGLKIYERIDLTNYPSHSDFFGKSIVVRDGDVATVIRCVGRPSRLSRAGRWSMYDVYEILVHGSVYHVFRQNIKLVKK